MDDTIEKAIMKRMERMVGYVPVGTTDLLKILAHPDMIALTEAYLQQCKDEW